MWHCNGRVESKTQSRNVQMKMVNKKREPRSMSTTNNLIQFVRKKNSPDGDSCELRNFFPSNLVSIHHTWKKLVVDALETLSLPPSSSIKNSNHSEPLGESIAKRRFHTRFRWLCSNRLLSNEEKQKIELQFVGLILYYVLRQRTPYMLSLLTSIFKCDSLNTCYPLFPRRRISCFYSIRFVFIGSS